MNEHFDNRMSVSEKPESLEEAFLNAFVRKNDRISDEAKTYLENQVVTVKGPWSEAGHVRHVYEKDGRIVVGYLGGESYYYPRSDSNTIENAIPASYSADRDSREISVNVEFTEKMVKAGFEAAVLNRLSELLPKLGLREGSKALFLGPSRTPLQFLVADGCGSVEVLEKNDERREWIRATSETLGISGKMTIREGQDADIAAAGYPEDKYELIVALSILDLVGENPEVYRRMLRAAKDGGKIAVGHHETIFGEREKLLLNRHAKDLGYSLRDLGVLVDDGHDPDDPFYNRDSFLLQVRKRSNPDIPKQEGSRGIAETLRLFAALESLGNSGQQDQK